MVSAWPRFDGVGAQVSWLLRLGLNCVDFQGRHQTGMVNDQGPKMREDRIPVDPRGSAEICGYPANAAVVVNEPVASHKCDVAGNSVPTWSALGVTFYWTAEYKDTPVCIVCARHTAGAMMNGEFNHESQGQSELHLELTDRTSGQIVNSLPPTTRSVASSGRRAIGIAALVAGAVAFAVPVTKYVRDSVEIGKVVQERDKLAAEAEQLRQQAAEGAQRSMVGFLAELDKRKMPEDKAMVLGACLATSPYKSVQDWCQQQLLSLKLQLVDRARGIELAESSSLAPSSGGSELLTESAPIPAVKASGTKPSSAIAPPVSRGPSPPSRSKSKSLLTQAGDTGAKGSPEILGADGGQSDSNAAERVKNAQSLLEMAESDCGHIEARAPVVFTPDKDGKQRSEYRQAAHIALAKRDCEKSFVARRKIWTIQLGAINWECECFR